MVNPLRSVLAGVLVAAALAGGVRTAHAQSTVGTTAVGVEAGLPLVVGLDASQRVSPKLRLAVGLGRLSGLTVVRAEGRYLVRAEVPLRFVPVLLVGAEQYFLKDGDDEASFLGLHAAVGVNYHLDSPISFGARLGALKTFGSSDDDKVEKFSLRSDNSYGMFGVAVRYHF